MVAQSPHGDGLKLDCAVCHTPAGWEVTYDSTHFNHFETSFPLTGTHQTTDCKSCHTDLTFENTPMSCATCHTDLHAGTVSDDCARCHNTLTWLVDNIPELHEANGFPLVGSHTPVACMDCHTSETHLRFDRLGNSCVNCHFDDFQATTTPNHEAVGYSTDCAACHDPFVGGWWSTDIAHEFFPLEGGHDIQSCNECHQNANEQISPTCMNCHSEDFNNTSIPNHTQNNFDQDCATCHTLDPGWSPATYIAHDAEFFPIYSGEHQGEWDQCIDCHTDPSNFSTFSCTNCHTDPETSDEHSEVNGFVYEDNACLACHPNGSEEDEFNHDLTAFPLTGAHIGVTCLECHSEGYSGTSSSCFDCHETQFNQAVNPNHTELNLSNECAQCHTTDPDWMPAEFIIHDEYYALNGAHAAIANNCSECHNNDDYGDAPNTCVGCHLQDFENTTDPNHQEAEFSNDCIQCHTEDSWSPAIDFDHNSVYALTGAHATLANSCIECHADGHDNTPTTCVGCHLDNFNATTDLDHQEANFPNDCAQCHNEEAWEPALDFDHNSIYALNGAHATIANNCIECHADGYDNTPTTCVGCHLDNFNATTDPDHQEANFPNDCAQCHNEEAWEPALDFDHNSIYALTGAHATIANNCIECHADGYDNTPTTCVGCHLDNFNATTDPDHQEANFPNNCAQCHTEDAWTPADFDHNSIYALNGAHATIANNCIECHADGYNNTPTTCVECHLDNFNATTDPDHQEANFPNDCAQCHTEDAWTPADFDHNSIYVLTGAHATIANNCIECHAEGYDNTPTTCVGCHLDNFNATTEPDHQEANFPNDCAQCHNEEAWEPALDFDHNSIYALNGAHATLANNCIECHADGYDNTPTTCIGCHLDDFNATTDPDHQEANFANDCAQCHTEDAWIPADFDHNSIYALNGAHATIANNCIECHADGYNNTPTTCVECHLDNFNTTTDPDHQEANFPNDCAQCHTEDAWTPADFEHNSIYALNGAHATIASNCIECHADGYNNTPTTCVGCHLDNFNTTTDPDHQEANFPNDCAQCHTEDAWTPADFEHNSIYALNGAHAAIASNCIECHADGYNNTPTTCAGCHLDNFNTTTDPDHQEANFPNDCAQCHTEDAWTPADFEHNSIYALNGAHAAIANNCIECHADGYNNTPTTCVGCHLDNFNTTTDPDHQEANFPNDCAQCHTEDAWTPADFDHNSIYALNGAHATIANNCIECHADGYNNTPTTCVGCHLDNFNTTTDPDHQEANFPNDCAQCHTEDAWTPADFDHNSIYALNGAHAAIASNCIECHADGYNNTPTTCMGCHLTDYNNTNSPDHQAAQFPTDCISCHSENAWEPATFDHDGMYFPIYSGKHREAWNECTDCHNDVGNYSIFTCIECHEHNNQNEVDNDHDEVNGYSYTPTSCFECHPTGDN